jgi:muramidase (phage lysozyme)
MPEGPVKRYLKEKYGSDEIADPDIANDPVMRGFLQTLSDPESGGAYNIKNGGSTFSDFSKFPEGIGPGGTSSAAGRYQFTSDTWKEVAGALGLTDFSPASQDRAARYLAEREYRTRTGRDLRSDILAGGHEAEITGALKGRWPSLPGGSQSRQTQDAFAAHLKQNSGPSEPLPTPPIPPAEVPSVGPIPSIPPAAAGKASSIDRSTSVTVGSITVNTKATDAQGIARDINLALVTQANRGAA